MSLGISSFSQHQGLSQLACHFVINFTLYVPLVTCNLGSKLSPNGTSNGQFRALILAGLTVRSGFKLP